jgi:hypothetical protein
VPGIVNLVRLMQVPDLVDRPDLKYPPFQPGLPKVLAKNYDVFASIRKQDVLLHHPYQSFSPVVEFLEQAVDDPTVVAIKMTVYRTGTDSILMELLMRAARQGKEVTVVVELMARFDEEANINWAVAPGGGRRARGVRRVRLQDPRQDADGGAARGRRRGRQRPAPLRAPRHRQLPSAHRAGCTPTSACSPATRRCAPT